MTRHSGVCWQAQCSRTQQRLASFERGASQLIGMLSAFRPITGLRQHAAVTRLWLPVRLLPLLQHGKAPPPAYTASLYARSELCAQSSVGSIGSHEIAIDPAVLNLYPPRVTFDDGECLPNLGRTDNRIFHPWSASHEAGFDH